VTGPRELLDQLDAAHERWRKGGWPAVEASMDLPRAVPQLTAALRAALDLADEMEAEATERDRMAERLPDQPAYHMEINRLVVAAEHQRRAAKQVRRYLTAALTPADTTGGAS
jgi:hypothetical protein